MKGICGIFQRDRTPVNVSVLQQMTAFLGSRGLTGVNSWTQGFMGLGWTGNSNTGNIQPVTLDGKVFVVVDGRIDGKKALQEKLAILGDKVESFGEESHWIAAAYQVWGENCLNELIGDFVFAVWDSRENKLFCSRDQLGVKPFYYADLGDCFLWSNTLDCLHLHPLVSGKLNELAIADFLLFDYNQDPETTTFQDIHRLPAGHCLTVTPEKITQRCYWSLPVPELLRYKHQEDYIVHYQALLDQAVGDRILCGSHASNIGILFSGGLDSNTVAATALDIAPSYNIQGFTVVYDRLIPDQERYYSNLAAQQLNLPLHYLIADDHTLFNGWKPTPEPYNDPFPLLSQQQYQQIAQHSPIVLSGNGGDEILRPSKVMEILGGMPFYFLLADLLHCVMIEHITPPWGTGILGKIRGIQGDLEAGFPQWFNPEFEQKYELRDRWRNRQQFYPPSPHPFRPRAYRDLLQPLWRLNFEASDPGFTKIPLEVRYPFLDLRLLNYALSLSPFPWCVDKTLARKTFLWRETQPQRHTVPPSIIHRPKSPLAGYPYVVAIQKGANPWENFTAPQLEPYINLPHFITIAQESIGGWPTWRNLRPVSLNYWLESFLSDNLASPTQKRSR